MRKWFKGLVFAATFVAAMLPCKAVFADDGWGTYGDNVKWHFYEATGTLQIEGEGAMDDAKLGSPGDAPWYSYREQVKKIVIGKGITHIGGHLFVNYKNLDSVSFPDTVTSIGADAFEGAGLKKLALPKHLASIGDSAFRACENLKSVEIPGTVKEIGQTAFWDCEKLSSVKLNEGVEVLGKGCFNDTAITTIAIPSSVKTISSEAFKYSHLDHITIPKTVTELGDRVFEYCNSLRYAVLDTQCGIPYRTFYDCRSLIAVKLGEGAASIDSGAFLGADKLCAVFVPASVTEIHESIFGVLRTESVTFYGYTDTAAYNYAGKNQLVKFVDVEAQGMGVWEEAWNKAVKEGAPSDSAKKTMKFLTLSAKKGASKITGRLSVSGATVKVQVGNAKYKKATVKKNTFSIKTPRLKKGTTIRIRVTKNGYKTLSRLIKIK